MKIDSQKLTPFDHVLFLGNISDKNEACFLFWTICTRMHLSEFY